MPRPFENALAFLDKLEADRRAAIALSEQKAEEAKLIQARQEGFQAAMEMLSCSIPVADAEADPKKPGRRRIRRPIPELILRELSFSGEAMTAAQIAKAIDYLPERTEMALQRMDKAAKCFGTQGADGQSATQPWLNSMAMLPLVIMANPDRFRRPLAARYNTEPVGSSKGSCPKMGMIDCTRGSRGPAHRLLPVNRARPHRPECRVVLLATTLEWLEPY